MSGFRSWRVSIFSCLAIALCAGGCTTSEGGRKNPTSGAAGTTSQAGTAGTGAGTAGTGAGTAGTGSGTAGASAGSVGSSGSTGSAGSGSGAAGTGTGTAGAAGGAGGTAGGSPDAATSMDAAAGTSGSDAGASSYDGPRTPPTCKTPKPSPIPSVKPTSECDFLLQSLDFEDNYSYVASQIEITNFGTALGASAINNCSPYCYSKELTIGVDIVGGGDPKALQGEVIVHFPTTGPELPIATAVGRDSLAWIQLGGDAAPAFKIMAQLVVESSTAGIIPAKDMHQVGFNDWLSYQNAEFKYFGIQAPPNGPFAVEPLNIVGIGFRIMAPANLAKGMEWHGVVYIDHLQIRHGGEDMPPGTYPYGL